MGTAYSPTQMSPPPTIDEQDSSMATHCEKVAIRKSTIETWCDAWLEDIPCSSRLSGVEVPHSLQPTLTVIVPAFNEERTIGELLRRVLALPIALEVIVVDDGSTDRTGDIAGSIAGTDGRVRIETHSINRGKGAAIRTALPGVRGSMVVIQDADLENDPRDLLTMAARFSDPNVSVVYGSRWLGASLRRRLSSSFLASWILSRLTNHFYGSNITDVPTCYKMFRNEVLRSIKLTSNGFEFCQEFTAKALLAGFKVVEIPIGYYPRTVAAGKKIRWFHALQGAWTLLKCRIVNNNLARRLVRPA